MLHREIPAEWQEPAFKWKFALKPGVREHYPILSTNAQAKQQQKRVWKWGIVQKCLDTILCPGVALLEQGGGTRRFLVVPSILSHSVDSQLLIHCYLKGSTNCETTHWRKERDPVQRNISHKGQVYFLCRKFGYIVPKKRNLTKSNLWWLAPLLLLDFLPVNVTKIF